MSSSITITPVAGIAVTTFVQSIGVNVHMWETNSSYTNVPLVVSDLAYLGIGNVRDDLDPWESDQQALGALASAGYKLDLLIAPASEDIPTFVTMLDTFQAAHPGSIAAIEGPNEVNIWTVEYNGGSTLADAALYQEALNAAIKADPSLTRPPRLQPHYGVSRYDAICPTGQSLVVGELRQQPCLSERWAVAAVEHEHYSSVCSARCSRLADCHY